MLFMLTENRGFFETEVLHNIWCCRFVWSLRVTWLCCILESNWFWRFLAHCIPSVSQANSHIQWYSRYLISHGPQKTSLHTKNEHSALLSCNNDSRRAFNQLVDWIQFFLGFWRVVGISNTIKNFTIISNDHFQRPTWDLNVESTWHGQCFADQSDDFSVNWTRTKNNKRRDELR